MPLRILSWNVNGLRAIQQRRKEPTSEILRKLGADIICLQETKLSKKDLEAISQLANVPGWQSYFGLGRLQSGYAGLVTFCREETVPVFAASEGLAETDPEGVSDPIHPPSPEDWARLPQEHLQHNDKEGRAVITDHGHFVLIHLYGPAVTSTQAQRFPRKLTFYKALELRVNTLISQGRAVVIAGDLNIAREPVDTCDWADSKLPPAELLEAFLSGRPDRRWFLEFLGSRQSHLPPEQNTARADSQHRNRVECRRREAPVDLFKWFHPNRWRAYTVWGTDSKRQRNFGSRVDYILLADAESSSRPHVGGGAGDSSCARGSLQKDASSLLSKVTACDILTEWEGSDHAPVFAELDIVLQKLDAGAASPKLESRQRFKGLPGGQRQLTSFFSKSSLGKRNRVDREETPPRPSLGEELAKARP